MAVKRTQPLLICARYEHCYNSRRWIAHRHTFFDGVLLFTVLASYRRKLLLSTLIRNAKRSLMLYESWNKSKLK